MLKFSDRLATYPTDSEFTGCNRNNAPANTASTSRRARSTSANSRILRTIRNSSTEFTVWKTTLKA